MSDNIRDQVDQYIAGRIIEAGYASVSLQDEIEKAWRAGYFSSRQDDIPDETIDPEIKVRAFETEDKLRRALQSRNTAGLLLGDNEIAALIIYIEYLESFEPIEESV